MITSMSAIWVLACGFFGTMFGLKFQRIVFIIHSTRYIGLLRRLFQISYTQNLISISIHLFIITLVTYNVMSQTCVILHCTTLYFHMSKFA